MEQLEKNYIYPSSIFASNKPHEVTTVLGSCVSVCLWDQALKVGGINHYMLPLWNGNGLASPKYGNIAIEKLIDKMKQMGCKKENLIAKVFGGANVIETNINIFNVGERNHQLAIETLEKENIPIIAKSLGGEVGRKIIFNTQTGDVMMKFLGKGPR
jgi:chemotaxis protein CheD